ncbi:MAG: NFACT RNA binding domain-containing protein [Acidithiobacillus sp.]
MDTLQLESAAQCLKPLCQGKVLQRVDEWPGGVVLHFRDEAVALLAHRAPLGLWRATRKDDPPPQSAFVKQLAQRLKGFRLEELSLPWADRIVRLDFSRTQLSKREDRMSLIAECFGGRGNIVLLDDEARIRLAWRWDNLEQARPRFLPGAIYTPANDQGGANDGPLQRMAPRYRPWDEPGQTALTATLAQRPHGCRPWWRLRRAGEEIIYPLVIPGWDVMAEIPWETAIALPAGAPPKDLAFAAALAQREAQQRKKLDNIRADLARWEDPEQYRRMAHALFALPDAVHPGGPLLAHDYTVDPVQTLSIGVPAGKRLHQQAQWLMGQARRSERGRRQAQARLAAQSAEWERLQALRISWERGNGAMDLRQGNNSLPGPGKASGSSAPVPSGSAPFGQIWLDGFELLWGRNAKENDRLTFRVANPWDLWFHVQDLPGSHVLLRRPQRNAPVPEPVIHAAARVALQQSQCRAMSAEVDWTEIRHLQRRPGGGPGEVIYRHFHSRRVRRDDQA